MDLLSGLPRVSQDFRLDHLPPEERRNALTRLETVFLHGMLTYATIDDPSLDQEQAARLLKSDLTDQTVRDAAILWLKGNVQDFDAALMFQYRTVQAQLPAVTPTTSTAARSPQMAPKPGTQDSVERSSDQRLPWLMVALCVVGLLAACLVYLYLRRT